MFFFFVAGVNEGEKKLEYNQHVLCKECNRQGRLELYMRSKNLTLFFLPVFRWGKTYIARTTCCNTVYHIDKEVVDKLKRGEINTIPDEALKKGFVTEKHCRGCGFVSPPDFEYCPKCGSRL